MIIKPISALKDYNKVVSEITPGNPVHLSKNGYDAYVIMMSEDYERQLAIKEVNSLLQESFDTIENGKPTFTLAEIKQEYDL